MIENTAKATRRKQTVDDAFMDKLQVDITALYRLNEARGSAMEAKDLGPLPTGAILLLGTLGAVWVGILLYVGYGFLKDKKKKL
jgi:multiple sugar transport system substrate-binding protein